MATTAFFNDITGHLFVNDDELDAQITITRLTDGRLQINAGDIPIAGGPATLTLTKLIFVSGLGGDDHIRLDDTSGPMPPLVVRSGHGDDQVFGAQGADRLFGSSGNDLLSGFDGDDILDGGSGNDQLVGGAGSDRLFGGVGNDLFIWQNNDGSDFIEGGAGFDTVQVNGANSSGDRFEIRMEGGRIMLERKNLGPVTLDIGASEVLDINGRGGNDVIIASDGLAELGVRLELDGGIGADVVVGGDSADVVQGGLDDDILLGGRGNDAVYGGTGDDVMIWHGGHGNDLIDGGDGQDTAQFNFFDPTRDVVRVRSDNGRVRIEDGTSTIYVTDAEITNINLLEDNDWFEAGGTGIETLTGFEVYGGAGADTLIGGGGGDLLDGGADHDQLRGRAGDDELQGGLGNDVLLGGSGDDLMIWSEGDGNDRMDGGPGKDGAVFSFSDLPDKIDLSFETSLLHVENTGPAWSLNRLSTTEAVEIHAGDGDDQVKLGDLSAAPDVDTVIVDGETGDDVIYARSIQSDVNLVLRGGTGADILFAGNTSAALVGGSGADQLYSFDGDDTLIGGDDTDLLVAGKGDDLLLGDDGNDTLIAGDGDDFLFGGDGNDILFGGEGFDFIDGGAGEDVAYNGEVIINLGLSARSEVGPDTAPLLARADPEAIEVLWDPQKHGATIFRNFEVGIDKIVIAAPIGMVTRSGAPDNDDSLMLETDDIGRTILSVRSNDDAFYEQWILEGNGLNGLTLDGLADSIVFL
ncbi:calcium-binding protein [Ruegeria sp. 2205SS24-7]|uniref:calcium-binding protein n=1 Tax=Ruegeria discodermiae TaxID=3064389 RepID=UPI0027407B12|nr:calcium-binding protein [Ruegeria sp. 2205SS24-7]MDP5218732.1 calcium-binding protein [Ruegeria sp. 2205SS24-7]